MSAQALRAPARVRAARAWFPALLVLALTVALLFLVLPVVAIFTHTSPGKLISSLGDASATDALRLSLETTAIAIGIIVVVGTPAAYFLATREFPGKALVVTLIELPLVLPPAVAGIGLLVAFGRVGLLGSTFEFLHIDIAFTWVAVVLAITLVASPLYVRQAIAAFEAVDPNLVAASRTLGAGPVRTFFRVALPLARGGLAAGEALCLARSIGEFGATIMFAGSMQGRTQTLTLAVYQEFDANFDTALAISALLVLVSLAILLALKLSALWRPSRQTSLSRFALSRSS
jgi:molybdate transport system permease protein